jgi:hypothetical protein
MSEKQITLNTIVFSKKTTPETISVERERILHKLFHLKSVKKHISNIEHHEKAIETLQEYIYIPPTKRCWNGRHVKYFNLNQMENLELKKGGIVLDDDGEYIKLKAHRRLIFKIKKTNSVCFMKPNQKDFENLKYNVSASHIIPLESKQNLSKYTF